MLCSTSAVAELLIFCVGHKTFIIIILQIVIKTAASIGANYLGAVGATAPICTHGLNSCSCHPKKWLNSIITKFLLCFSSRGNEILAQSHSTTFKYWCTVSHVLFLQLIESAPIIKWIQGCCHHPTELVDWKHEKNFNRRLTQRPFGQAKALPQMSYCMKGPFGSRKRVWKGRRLWLLDIQVTNPS